ncbi:MAG: DUF3426 domain-containing protein [Nitrosomonas sp.]|nr:DUF3426 domain-containing protein [Nitrosomonas sp.]
MALITRCSECSTVFRLTIDELRAHDGQVQCNQCQQVFDAFASLVTIPESLIINLLSDKETTRISESVSPPRHESVAPAFDFLNQEKDLAYEASLFGDQPPSHKTRKWLFTSLMMLIILVGYSLYFYRIELSVSVPAIKPFLEKYCLLLQCTISLPRQEKLLSLESSDLRIDPNRPGEMVVLTATIQNHAPFPQELPALLLTLTDNQGQPLAILTLTAKDYLRPNNKSKFFAAKSEIEIEHHFDNSELKATGYRLLLHYP